MTIYKNDDFIYDSDTGEMWHARDKITPRNGFIMARKNQRCSQKINGRGYKLVTLKGRASQQHRIAWLLVKGRWPVGEIDHINGDKTDNRFFNLREVTCEEQCKNRPLRKDNKSGISGVFWLKKRRRWLVKANINRKGKTIGYFKDFFNACCARKSVENKYGYHENHGRKR